MFKDLSLNKPLNIANSVAPEKGPTANVQANKGSFSGQSNYMQVTHSWQNKKGATQQPAQTQVQPVPTTTAAMKDQTPSQPQTRGQKVGSSAMRSHSKDRRAPP